MVSTGIQKGGIADRLDVADSVVAVSGDPTRRVSYGGLMPQLFGFLDQCNEPAAG